VVIQTLPSNALSSQYVAVSMSQNFIRPDVSGTPPDVTLAVKVRIVPVATDVPGDTLNMVTVALPAAHTGATAINKIASTVQQNESLARMRADLPR
jgi:hypothetical protein